jgi:hypothetical protein
VKQQGGVRLRRAAESFAPMSRRRRRGGFLDFKHLQKTQSENAKQRARDGPLVARVNRPFSLPACADRAIERTRKLGGRGRHMARDHKYSLVDKSFFVSQARLGCRFEAQGRGPAVLSIYAEFVCLSFDASPPLARDL